VQLFLFSVAFVLVVSALCSLSEAALYAVGPAYVRRLEESGVRAGRLLAGFKASMGRPITAILVLNTVANTAGAVIAGAQARLLFGEGSLFWFPALFTLMVLVFSEIVPKVVGVVQSRVVSRAVAVPLDLVVRGLSPIVWVTERFSDAMTHRREPLAPEEEVHRIADLSAEEGSILPHEAELVKNVLALDRIRAGDIMTPRTVVFKQPDNLTVEDIRQQAWTLPHARIPVFDPEEPDDWTGVVMRRDILAALGRDEFGTALKSLAKPLLVVPETLRGHELLERFLKRRRHLFGVIDEFGHINGIVTLEDVLEELIGREIVDETDREVDMRDVARRRRRRQVDDAGAGDEA
jgi:CBS domain containing-hemolysin-like protein